MTVMIVSGGEFNHDVARAKRAAERGTVFITDRGKLSHVLLSIADYRRLTGERRKIMETLSCRVSLASISRFRAHARCPGRRTLGEVLLDTGASGRRRFDDR